MPDLIVTNITSLDEARYFSARGVSMAGFDLDKLDIPTLNAITGWIVGPTFFGTLSSLDENLLFELSEKTDLKAICIPQEMVVPDWYQGHVLRLITHPITTTTESRERLLIDAQLLSKNTMHLPAEYWIYLRDHSLAEQARAGAPQPQGFAFRSTWGETDTETFYETYDDFFEKAEALF